MTREMDGEPKGSSLPTQPESRRSALTRFFKIGGRPENPKYQTECKGGTIVSNFHEARTNKIDTDKSGCDYHVRRKAFRGLFEIL